MAEKEVPHKPESEQSAAKPQSVLSDKAAFEDKEAEEKLKHMGEKTRGAAKQK